MSGWSRVSPWLFVFKRKHWILGSRCLAGPRKPVLRNVLGVGAQGVGWARRGCATWGGLRPLWCHLHCDCSLADATARCEVQPHSGLFIEILLHAGGTGQRWSWSRPSHPLLTPIRCPLQGSLGCFSTALGCPSWTIRSCNLCLKKRFGCLLLFFLATPI